MSSPVPPDQEPAPGNTSPSFPRHMEMKEFTLRAVLLGLLMTVVLGPPTLTSDCAPESRSRQPIRPQ